MVVGPIDGPVDLVSLNRNPFASRIEFSGEALQGALDAHIRSGGLAEGNASVRIGTHSDRRSVTDPYQPIERKLNLTRHLLEVLVDKHRPKLVVQTRSPDVVRDCDLFRAIDKNGGRAQVNMTVTTDDEDVRRAFEPSCPSNTVRLQAIAEIQDAGVDACITMTPLLLLSRRYTFAESLLETKVKKFIIQPFHFQRGKFIAATREAALDIMAEKLNCDRATFRDRYLEHYESSFRVLNKELPQLGQGKDGFKPPF